ncbi:MAG: dipeptidase [Firmicutes bacterium]|jgi:membrane dipeptidase|nr:dipeptidase [Bacillota bacterium]
MFMMDAHCDTLMDVVSGRRKLGETGRGGHLDLPRMAEAGMSAQVFAIYVPEEFLPGASATRAMRYVDAFYQEAETEGSLLAPATRAQDVACAKERGKIAGFLSIEGGEVLEGSIELLRIFYRLGVRLMTLTWSNRNQIADGCYEERTRGGLTRFGVEVVREMDRLGMVVDVSHLSEAGFWDVMEVSTRPVIASHSNSKVLWSHPRNLTDEQARAIAEKDGVIGVSFVGLFLGDGRRTIGGIADHIDHFANLVGPEHVGIGSDFDGMSDEYLPAGISSVLDFPAVAGELAHRGYSDEEISGIMGENLLRVVGSVIG